MTTKKDNLYKVESLPELLEVIGKKFISHKIENTKSFKENLRKSKTFSQKTSKFFVTENN